MTQWMKICMPIRKYGESELIWPCLVSHMVEKSISVYILFCILLIVVFVYNVLTCILVWITLWFFMWRFLTVLYVRYSYVLIVLFHVIKKHEGVFSTCWFIDKSYSKDSGFWIAFNLAYNLALCILA